MIVHDRIKFDARWHSYMLDGKKLPSVTGLVKSLCPPFDRDGNAARVAARENRTVESVVAEWKAKGETAMIKGTMVHAAAQSVLTGNKFVAHGEGAAEVEAFKAWWTAAKENLEVRAVEKVVGDAELGIAGTLDLLVHSRKSGKLHVFDYKTGSNFETGNKWGRFLLPPFDDLPDNELERYSLQVSLYRLILERDGETGELGDGWIVWLTSAAVPFRANDHRERLAAWLKEKGQTKK